MDLGERVVRALDAGMSRVEAAPQLPISNALIGKLLRQQPAGWRPSRAGGTSPTPVGRAAGLVESEPKRGLRWVVSRNLSY
jgi:hypothetical protein